MTNLALLLALLALPPAPAGYVTDAADVLDDAREQALNERLGRYETETSHDVIVYVDRRLPEGTTLEEMSAEARRTWGKSVILFLFIDDRRSRIEVAPALSTRLTDERAKAILVELRQPLRDRFYTTAAEQGIERIIGALAPPVAAPVAVPAAAPVPRPAPVERNRLKPILVVVGTLALFGLACVGVFAFVAALVRNNRTNSRGATSNQWPQQPFPPNDFLHHYDSTPLSFASHDSSPSSSGSDNNSSGGHGASDQW